MSVLGSCSCRVTTSSAPPFAARRMGLSDDCQPFIFTLGWTRPDHRDWNPCADPSIPSWPYFLFAGEIEIEIYFKGEGLEPDRAQRGPDGACGDNAGPLPLDEALADHLSLVAYRQQLRRGCRCRGSSLRLFVTRGRNCPEFSTYGGDGGNRRCEWCWFCGCGKGRSEDGNTAARWLGVAGRA